MELLLLFAVLALTLVCGAACATAFDAFKARSESLSEALLLRASYMDPWLGLIPKGEYPQGEGYVRSVFEIGRSEPTSDEETWTAIAPIAENNADGACTETWNEVEVGLKERTYKPEAFALTGPLLCQDQLPLDWNTVEVWAKYFDALEKRNKRSVVNRLQNIYTTFVPKASANANFAFSAGTLTAPVAAAPTMTSLEEGNLPVSELMQDMLDETAAVLIEEGASSGNTNGWITIEDAGPTFPLLIGLRMSKRLFLNNPELRGDANAAYTGKGELNPTLGRIGAKQTLGNFRHVVNPYPPRWTTQQVDSTGSEGAGYIGGVYGADDGTLKRVPVWVMSDDSDDATKGSVAKINPSWASASLAPYEGAYVLSPEVFTEEILRPINAIAGARWSPKNYFGEWDFVTGNDAVLGFTSCTGITDPLKTRGRHFGRYRHAPRPGHTTYGRFILFKRCSGSFTTLTCS